MDSSRFKRREATHTPRQTTKKATGGSIDGFATPASSWQPRAALTQRDHVRAEQAVAKPTAPVVTDQAPPKRAGIDMGLPGGDSDFQAHTKVRSSKWRKLRPIMMRTTAIMLVLIIASGGFLVSQGYFKVRKVFKGGTASAAALTANVDPSRLKGEGDGRVNILLLGRGGGSHEAPDLTDTIMLASIDPVNHTSALLSIPRDLWVDVPNFSTMKINAAWETGKYKYVGKISHDMKLAQANQAGFDLVDSVVTSVTGLTIHYNLLVDFNAFSKAVDTVGGVTVNVPENLVDPTMAWENGNNPILAKAGVQQFDGKHALIYVRSRETTSDFARGQRQRVTLLALKEKVETVGVISSPIKLAGLMSAFADNAQSDLSLGDATRLASIAKDIPSDKVKSVGLTADNNSGTSSPGYVTTGSMNNQSVVLPKAGLFNYGAIQEFIRGELKDGYLVKEDSKLLVLNGTNVAGLAGTKSTELKSYNYNVVAAANAPTRNYAKTIVVDLTAGKDKYTKNYLEQRFSTTAVTAVPDPAILPNGADFVIILGTDASISSKN